MNTLKRDITDPTVQAIISWQCWIIVQERQQLIGSQLFYRPVQYMQHLQVTYDEQTSHADGPQESLDAARRQGKDQEPPLASSVEVTDTCTDIQGEAWTHA
jgi:hypothetical protein